MIFTHHSVGVVYWVYWFVYIEQSLYNPGLKQTLSKWMIFLMYLSIRFFSNAGIREQVLEGFSTFQFIGIVWKKQTLSSMFIFLQWSSIIVKYSLSGSPVLHTLLPVSLSHIVPFYFHITCTYICACTCVFKSRLSALVFATSFLILTWS